MRFLSFLVILQTQVAFGQHGLRSAICSGAAQLNNGSVVTLGQSFSGMMNSSASGITIRAGIVPTFQTSGADTNQFVISRSVILMNGRSKLGFIVAPGRTWVVLGSTNLLDWEPVWADTADDPWVEFEDFTTFLHAHRFYRVWLP